VCAFVVLRPGIEGGAAKAKEIQDYVKQVLAPYKYPRDVRFAESLPHNASGKLQRFALRKIIEDEQLGAGAAEHREDTP
jgi:2-aminobenzoate-CoA ligase